MPVSTRPVTTVPRPEIENTSSIGIRNGLSSGRSGLRDVFVNSLHQLENGFGADFGIAAFEAAQEPNPDDRNVVARRSRTTDSFADFQLDELEDFLVVDLIDLVQEHDQSRNADLTGEQDVLAGLRHRAVSRADTTRIAPSIWAAPVIMFFT